MEFPPGSSAFNTMAIWEAFVMPFSPNVRVSVCEAPVFTSPTLVVPPLASTPVSDFTSAPLARATLPDSKIPLPGLCIVRIVDTAPRPVPVTPPRLESKMRSAEAVYDIARHVVTAKSSASKDFLMISFFMIKDLLGKASRKTGASSWRPRMTARKLRRSENMAREHQQNQRVAKCEHITNTLRTYERACTMGGPAHLSQPRDGSRLV